MHFFIPMIPPRVTHQQHGVTFRQKGVRPFPVFYDTPELAAARETYLSRLAAFRPEKPMIGPVFLKVIFCFPSRKERGKHHGEYKFTRPDTDNMIKLFKDCMTVTGFWQDDAQVASEWVEKRYCDQPGVYVLTGELKDGKQQGSPDSPEKEERPDG